MLLLASAVVLTAAGKLEIYSIDVEGGQATLFVSPSGETMLVDAGWSGFNHRDAERIAAAAKAAHVKRIDYLVITHYHRDHVGGVPQLAEKLPIRNFVDHGQTTETGQAADVLFGEYVRVRDKGKHIVVKPGDTLPIKGIDVKIVSANGDVLPAALPGNGQPNPDCGQTPSGDGTENERSVGMVITYGRFRAIDLGDLTKNKEYGLVCPTNKLGTANLLVVSHHGTTPSNWPSMIHALHPQVALMNNGPKKGGDAVVWQTIHDTPGLEDFWQVHYAVAAGKEHNSPDPFLANIDDPCEGNWLRITAEKYGSFTVLNQRNKFEKSYKAR